MIFLWCRPPFLRRRKTRKIPKPQKNRGARPSLAAKCHTKRCFHLAMHRIRAPKVPETWRSSFRSVRDWHADPRAAERVESIQFGIGCQQAAVGGAVGHHDQGDDRFGGAVFGRFMLDDRGETNAVSPRMSAISAKTCGRSRTLNRK